MILNQAPSRCLLAACVSTCIMLIGCDSRDNITPPMSSASDAAVNETMAGDGTIGGTGLVSDTTFGQGAVANSSTSQTNAAAAASPDGVLADAPTSAGIPVGSTTATPTASSSVLQEADRRFVLAAGENSAYELAAAKMAFNKAKGAEVKMFASMLMDHHAQSNERLQQIASNHGLALPSAPGPAKQQMIDRLSEADGMEFDRQFLETVGIREHQADIALFQQVGQNATDAAVRAFAQTTLPLLRQHLARAQELQAARAGGSTATTATP